MKIADATALVTGANRGLGREFARQLVERGAKVYAAARTPEKIDVPGVTPLRLDITDPDAARAAADAAADVDLLVNNAGIATHQNLLTGDMDLIRAEMDTHYYGTLAGPARSRPSSARTEVARSSTCCRTCPSAPTRAPGPMPRPRRPSG